MHSEQKVEQHDTQAPGLKGLAVTVHRAGSLGTAPPSLITNSAHHPASASSRFAEKSVCLPESQQASEHTA